MKTPRHLNAAERDALYSLIVARLTGIDDVYLAVEREEWDVADRLAGEFSDFLRFLQDLGWGNHGKAAELSAGADVLRRCFRRLLERAEVEDRDEAKVRDEQAEHANRNQLVRQVCTKHLEHLDPPT